VSVSPQALGDILGMPCEHPVAKSISPPSVTTSSAACVHRPHTIPHPLHHLVNQLPALRLVLNIFHSTYYTGYIASYRT
jgi:hypothetical protein